MSGNIFCHHTWQWKWVLLLVGGGQGCCQTSYSVQDGSYNYLAQNVNNSKVKKS